MNSNMVIIVLFLVFSLFLAGCPSGNSPQPGQTTENTTVNNTPQPPSGGGKTSVKIKNEPDNLAVPPDGNENGTATVPPSLPSRIIPGYTSTPEERFAVYFINVGTGELQGDSILIKKGDFDMLVDAGNNQAGGKVIDFLRSKGVDDLEVLVSTHADSEHYGGMPRVLDEFGVESFWWPGYIYGDDEYGQLVKRVNSDGITIKEVKRGEKFLFNGLTFEIHNPSVSRSFGDKDNDAIVLRIVQGSFCALLTSDIKLGAQGALANDPSISVRCSILQIPDHGLGRATNQIGIFLLRVSPLDAILSGSAYDPSADLKGTRFTLFEKLRLKGIRYYENYLNGTIRVESDGSEYTINFLPN